MLIPRLWSSLVASFAGKALGFFRVQLIVVAFGATSLTDALFLALTLLAIFDSVFVSGGAVILAQAIYARADVTGRGRSGSIAFARSAAIWTTFAVAFTAAMLASLPILGPVLAPGFDRHTQETLRSIVWAGAFVPVLTVLLVFASTINRVHGREALFSINQVVVNGAGILVLAIAIVTGTLAPLQMAQWTMIGTALAAFVMLAVQYRAARHYSPLNLLAQFAKAFSLCGMRPRLTSARRQVVGVSPLIVALFVQQMFALVILAFASTAGEGGIAAIGIADRLTAVVAMLLVGTFLTILEPRWARAVAQGDSQSISGDTRFIFLLVSASAATLACAGESLVLLLFGYGAADKQSLLMVTDALILYAVALPFSSFVLLATRALAVTGAVRALPAINVGALGVLAATAYAANKLGLGLVGIATAYCCSVTLQSAAHYWLLMRQMPEFRGSALSVGRLAGTVALTAAVTWAATKATIDLPDIVRVIVAAVAAHGTLIIGSIMTREPFLASARRLLKV